MLLPLHRLLALFSIASVGMAQASFTTHGRGSLSPPPDSGPVLYGIVPVGGSHLNQASLRFTSAGGDWSVRGGGELIEHTETAMRLPLGDGALASSLELTFSFPYPGGSTRWIDVNPNGRIYLEAGTNPWSGGWSAEDVLPNFLSATPSICVLGTRVDLGADGRLLFEVVTVGPDRVALVTWDGVDVGPSAFQCQLWSTGDVVLSYGATSGSNSPRNALVGVSAGRDAPDPGPSHLPLPLTLSLAHGAPVIGDSITLAVAGVPSSATSAVLWIEEEGASTFERPTPTGLQTPGLVPEGGLALTPHRSVPMELAPPNAWVTLPLEYDPALVGSRMRCQVVVAESELDDASHTLVPKSTLVSGWASITVGDPPDLAFVVEGSNSFYGSPEDFGFFRLESDPGANHADVVQLEVEFTDAQSYFDTVGNAGLDGQGFFSDGNGTGPACISPYYGSDVATGLVYGGPSQGPGCNGTGTTGWVGADPVGGSTTRFRRVVFQFDDFAAGEEFRFDCDTDGGLFNAGAQPLLVTVELADGTVISQPVEKVTGQRAEGVLIQ